MYMYDLDNHKTTPIVSSFQASLKPQILTYIQLCLEKEKPYINNIADLISADAGISSAILKITNSPFYGINGNIYDIKQAIKVIGLRAVNGLIAALILKSSIQDEAFVSLECFDDDSLDVANDMTFTDNKVKNTIPMDRLIASGLFANCCIPLLAIKFKNYKKTLMKANYFELEEQVNQPNHAILGYYLASSWHFPKELCTLISRRKELAIQLKYRVIMSN